MRRDGPATVRRAAVIHRKPRRTGVCDTSGGGGGGEGAPRGGPAWPVRGDRRADRQAGSDPDVAGDQRLEETAGPAGVVEDQGPRHLHLPHRQLPPVAGGPVRRGERGRMTRIHRSKNACTSAGPKQSQTARRPTGSAQEANPLASSVQVRVDVVQLAVIPAGPVRLLQVQHRDAGSRDEAVHVPPEPVADLLKQRGRRNRMTQMPGQEADHLAADLKKRAVRIEVEPVHALHFQADMPSQHLVNVPASVPARSVLTT